MLERRATPEQKELAPKLWQKQVQTEQALRHWWLTLLPLYFHSYDAAIGIEQLDRMILQAETCDEVLAEDLPNYDVENSLESVSAPTVVMVGRKDWVTPVDESELIAGKIAHSELKVFEKSGHYPFIEENAEFIRAVADFASRSGTGAWAEGSRPRPT
jgi:proline iminopeptidase